MNYNQVQINKVDNGYVVSVTKIDLLTNKPDQKVAIFKDFDEVVAYLKT
jgi:hypothetical protein